MPQISLAALVHLAQAGLLVAYGPSLRDVADAPITTTPQAIYAGIAIASLAVLLAGIVVILWLVRATENALSFKPHTEISPLGAVLWYLVPFMSMFKPYETMSNIWYASSGQRREERLVRAWWGVFLLNGVAAWAAFFRPQLFGIASALASVALALVAIRLIRRVSALQIEAHQTSLFGGPNDSGGPSIVSALAG